MKRNERKKSSHGQCNAGFSGADYGVCTVCEAGTFKPVPGSAACSPCVRGTYSAAVGATAEQACSACPAHTDAPAGSTDASACVCNAGYTVNDGTTACAACVAGSYKQAAGPHACTTCRPGRASATHGAVSMLSCGDCPIDTVSSKTHEQCISCGKYGVAARASVECQCLAGGTGDMCTACEPGTYKDAPGSHTCTACGPGNFSATNAATACTECPADTFPSHARNNCTACPEHESAPRGSTECVCAAAATTSGEHCVGCEAGKYKEQPGNQACVLCGADVYSLSSSAHCEACPTNSSAPAGSGTLTACSCNAGFTGADGGNCRKCHAHAFSPQGSTPCTCNAGSTGADDDVCSQCVRGKYKSQPGSDSCHDCEPGHYSTTVGATSAQVCTQCPENTKAFATSDERTDCTCIPGYTGADGANCTACVAGTFKPLSGSAACMPCVSGAFSATDGATTCVECAVGRFVKQRVVCVDCVEGKYATARGSGKDTCLDCPVGVYSDAGASTCSACEIGKFTTRLKVSTTMPDWSTAGVAQWVRGINSASCSEVCLSADMICIDANFPQKLPQTVTNALFAQEHTKCIFKHESNESTAPYVSDDTRCHRGIGTSSCIASSSSHARLCPCGNTVGPQFRHLIGSVANLTLVMWTAAGVREWVYNPRAGADTIHTSDKRPCRAQCALRSLKCDDAVISKQLSRSDLSAMFLDKTGKQCTRWNYQWVWGNHANDQPGPVFGSVYLPSEGNCLQNRDSSRRRQIY